MRDDRDRNRRADRQADLQHQVERRRAEDHAEQRADHERQRRQLAHRSCRWDVRLERRWYVLVGVPGAGCGDVELDGAHEVRRRLFIMDSSGRATYAVSPCSRSHASL